MWSYGPAAFPSRHLSGRAIVANPHRSPEGAAMAAKGILPDHMISELAASGGIRPARDFAPDQIQPASLDLRLGSVAYRVRASFLPGPRTTVTDRIKDLRLHEFSLTAGAVLETN